MFLALHECHHVSKWRVQSTCPNVGEHITCGTCGQPTTVTDVFGPWRVRCHDCNRVNGHATLRTTVIVTATKHAQEWTDHRVWVWQYGNLNSRILVTKSNVGVQAPLFTDAPF